MTCVDLVIRSPIHMVWAELADAYSYGDWVVGAKEIREVEGHWPERGSLFHHTVGMGPLNLKDTTKVVDVEPTHRIVLEARARPLGRARIEISLSRVGGGTTVALEEEAISPSVVRFLNPVLAPFVRARNRTALKRLARVSETRRTRTVTMSKEPSYDDAPPGDASSAGSSTGPDNRGRL
jgi:uncharacterized protein YndB with AHSA1/START domain